MRDEPWYAHYFRDEELLVLFRDAIFASAGPATWQAAVQHGLGLGIPREQLDFKPRTEEDARKFFAAN